MDIRVMGLGGAIVVVLTALAGCVDQGPVDAEESADWEEVTEVAQALPAGCSAPTYAPDMTTSVGLDSVEANAGYGRTGCESYFVVDLKANPAGLYTATAFLPLDAVNNPDSCAATTVTLTVRTSFGSENTQTATGSWNAQTSRCTASASLTFSEFLNATTRILARTQRWWYGTMLEGKVGLSVTKD